jgi:isocitrate dehydrogenase
MMLEYMGWTEAADLIRRGIGRSIQEKVVTYDFARLLEGATEVSTSDFGNRIIHNMSP